MSTELRPTDAGTTNEWTFAGEGKVFVWRTGLPAVLGRPAVTAVPVIAITNRRNGGDAIVITPHQARALLEILPAAIALAEGEDK